MIVGTDYQKGPLAWSDFVSTKKMFYVEEIRLKMLFYQQTRAKPGAALQTPLFNKFIHSFINSLTDPLVKISLRRLHAQTVKNGGSSHKTNNIDIFSKILNLEGSAL